MSGQKTKIFLFLLIMLCLFKANVECKEFYCSKPALYQISFDSLSGTTETHEKTTELGISLSMPDKWAFISSKDFAPEAKDEGIFIVDTVNRSAVMIVKDSNGKDFRDELFPDKFNMNDSTVRAFTGPAVITSGRVNKKYYLFINSEKFSVNMVCFSKYLDEFLPLAEAVIRSIKLVNPSY